LIKFTNVVAWGIMLEDGCEYDCSKHTGECRYDEDNTPEIIFIA